MARSGRRSGRSRSSRQSSHGLVATARGSRRARLATAGRPPQGRSRSTATLCRMRSISRKAASFTESVIRDMNRRAVEAGAVSLAQGFPDFACPPALKAAAAAAVDADVNQYAITWGSKPLRDAIAAKTARFHPGWVIDPETEITVVNGATEGMIAAMLGLLDPGDEVIVFEPFYENYGPAVRHAPRAGLADRSGRAACGGHAEDAGDRDQHAAQPDGQGVLARGARA